MSKRKGTRPTIGELWEYISPNDRAVLVRFAQTRIHPNMHLGLLSLLSVGRFFDAIDYRVINYCLVAPSTKIKVRSILSNAILKSRRAKVNGSMET